MSARHFGYYDDWKTATLTCPKCGWSGTFEQGDVEHYEELMDSSCPACKWPDAPMLAIVPYPTTEESKANWDKLSDEEKAGVARRKHFLAEVEKTSLKSASELPDLSATEIRLSWDLREDEEGMSWTDIRHGDQILWSEPAVYEGAERFAEVVGILKRKYGSRLLDVVPTEASGLYLYGDRLAAISTVDEARASLGGPRCPSQPDSKL